MDGTHRFVCHSSLTVLIPILTLVWLFIIGVYVRPPMDWPCSGLALAWYWFAHNTNDIYFGPPRSGR